MELSLPQTLEQLQLSNPSHWTGAVNFLILDDSVVFIKRSEFMPTHKGQIAFIGGHKHLDDADPIDNAFREFEEESGLDRSNLDFLGLLSPMKTSPKHRIIPVLSRIKISADEFFGSVKSNGEWTEIYKIRISELTNLERWSYGNYVSIGNFKSKIVFFPFFDPITQSSNILWGATGKIVFNAVNILHGLN